MFMTMMLKNVMVMLMSKNVMVMLMLKKMVEGVCGTIW